MDATTREEAEIVGKLYSGILHTERWHAALKAVTEYVGGQHATLILLEPPGKVVVADTPDLPSPVVDDYDAYHVAHDPAREPPARPAAASRPGGPRGLGHPRIPASEFYQDFFHRHDMGALMCAPMVRLPSAEWYISFQRARERGPFAAEDERALLRLVPHLRESVRLRLRLTDMERQAALARASMDAIAAPLLIVDAEGHVMLANTSGDQWQAQHGKRLRTHSQWQRILQTACGRAGPARAAAFRLHTSGEDYVVATPLAPDHRYAAAHMQPLAMVLVRSASGQPLSLQESLTDIFRLTPAEARLLELLQQDLSLAQAAESLGVSYATVKTQLASLFQKTGTRRQAELLLLVTRLSMAAVQGTQ
ncbi:helix-turn-helix transcriptional regulator [Bordetella genomosp. 13]|uniref:helix-turn-helix transcriptional regulator n=1 Tax=Bordetella genomosp. 13 TaxID=463040 RepID=UPI001642C912|nr:helix-turn-helix transcriptional regulator [Bordetella genomosp. 13]